MSAEWSELADWTLDRRVRNLTQEHGWITSPEPTKRFRDYLTEPNIVLLGDPGSGKTHLLMAACQNEHGHYTTARQVLVYQAPRDCPALYVDALDEHRSRADDVRTVDALVAKLAQVEPRRLRLSCRAADWFGESDLEILAPYFEKTGGVVVLALEPLSEGEAIQLLRELGHSSPQDFVAKAEAHGLSTFLQNPQSLLMLHDAVGAGDWPSSKKQLFTDATNVLLEEHAKRHKALPHSRANLSSLREAAGASLASMLISNTVAISLRGEEHGSLVPSYLDVPLDNAPIVLQTLMRRLFTENGPEQVTYAHRTVAEYLAATWLAERVRSGYPLSRLTSLMSFDGTPTSELRGLHAWMAALLPEYSGSFIKADPYGVLVYGDATALSPTDRMVLLEALEQLARRDPWFRRSSWAAEPLGALSTPELEGKFREILTGPDVSFHLRSVALDALACGDARPALFPELESIVTDGAASFTERYKAYQGICRSGSPGRARIADIYRGSLSGDCRSIDIRATILTELYSEHFSPNDVVGLFAQLLRAEDQRGSALWRLSYELPVDSLPEILDGLAQLTRLDSSRATRRNVYDFESGYSTILDRALEVKESVQAGRLWCWLQGLYSYRRYHGESERHKNVDQWLRARQSLLLQMLREYIEHGEESNPYVVWHEFSSTTRGCLLVRTLTEWVIEEISSQHCSISDFMRLAYEISLWLNMSAGSHSEQVETLLELPDSHRELDDIRQRYSSWSIESWRTEDTRRRRDRQRGIDIAREHNKAKFEQDRLTIRAGEHLVWLTNLSQLYFGHFSDLDREATPVERLELMVGRENVPDCLTGLRNLLDRQELPTVEFVAELDAKSRHYPWWFAVLAGMRESWARSGDLSAFSDSTLETALAIASALLLDDQDNGSDSKLVRGSWKDAVYQEKPELAVSVYRRMCRVSFSKRKRNISAFAALFYEERLKASAGTVALELLSEFVSADPHALQTMLALVLPNSAMHGQLNDLATRTLGARGLVRSEARATWMAVGLLLDFEEFRQRVSRYWKRNPQLTWVLRDFLIFDRHRSSERLSPSAAQLGFIVRQVGRRFRNVPHPSDGWSGDSNPWDASEFVRWAIERLSTILSDESRSILRELAEDASLQSFHDHLKHALASNRAAEVEERFVQPDWETTVAALRGGKPANLPDLKALVEALLLDVSNRVGYDNADIFKSFWNEDKYGRVASPKPEESCRDRVLEMLRPKLNSLGIHVEPEGHMATDKRADLLVLGEGGMKLPIEAKRHYHADLWTACSNQLERQYARDPEAKGYGIFLVFWFGVTKNRRVPRPPGSRATPRSPEELWEALDRQLDEESRHRLSVVVIDVENQ